MSAEAFGELLAYPALIDDLEAYKRACQLARRLGRADELVANVRHRIEHYAKASGAPYEITAPEDLYHDRDSAMNRWSEFAGPALFAMVKPSTGLLSGLITVEFLTACRHMGLGWYKDSVSNVYWPADHWRFTDVFARLAPGSDPEHVKHRIVKREAEIRSYRSCVFLPY